MRVDPQWQARRVAMARARVELAQVWELSELSALEWLSVLAEEMRMVSVRHRNRTEVNPVAGPLLCDECTIDEDPLPWCDCQDGETCSGPCRQRAHHPRSCPRRGPVAGPAESTSSHGPSVTRQ